MSESSSLLSRNLRRTPFFALGILVLFLLSGALGGATGSPAGNLAAVTHLPTAAAAPTVPASSASGPLVKVAPSSPMLLPSTSSPTHYYTVIPSSAPTPASIEVLVALKPTADMSSLLSQVQQPDSPVHNHFLTNAELGQLFGASPSTTSQAVSYFQGFGLTAIPSTDGLTLTVRGPTPAMAAAFHTQIQEYARQYTSPGVWNPTFGASSAQMGSVSTVPFFANSAPVSLPASLASQVSGIVGLDEMQATPDLSLPAGLAPGSDLSAVPHVGSACASTARWGTCLSAAQAFNDSYGNFTWLDTNSTSPLCIMASSLCNLGDYQFLMPATLPALTGAHNLWSGASAIGGVSDEGQGVTVAVVEVGCISPQTLQNFSRMLWGNPNQLTDRFTQIALGNQLSLAACENTGFSNGWTIETALDIEYLAAMAPKAHIDLIGLSNPSFESFDAAYQFITSYMTTGTACPVSFPVATQATIVGIANDTGACSVTITSNSYGSGELLLGYESGAPIYLLVENQLLAAMSLEGITNFFASGDYGSSYFFSDIQASVPAIATGSTSVGGGMLTAASPDELPFQNQSKYTPFCLNLASTGCIQNWTLNVTNAAGVYSFNYWAYGYGLLGTYQGIVGGGWGPSFQQATPWWQVGNDTYTSGTKLDPIVSGAAAFNMTVWAPVTAGGDDGWAPTYGGTSFATPITAGEWALVEEQANLQAGSPKMGDINAILYALHGAHEASVPYASTNPFVQMGYKNPGFNNANWDAIGWYLYNLSYTEPYSIHLPNWGFSLDNPAGPGWSFLSGLGMISADTLSGEVVGSSLGAPSMMDAPFDVVLVSGATTTPFTNLTAGTAYTFEVVSTATGAPIPNVEVWAYSGGANQGAYGGGKTTWISSATGTFSYTPAYAPLPSGIVGNFSQYAYFEVVQTPVSVSSQWAFHLYSVSPHHTQGSLTLTVLTPSGAVSSGVAQVTTFTAFDLSGYYTLTPSAVVTFNGTPVTGAIVTETGLSWNWSQSRMGFGTTFPSSLWAPGAPVGTFVTGDGGMFGYFINAFTAENNGITPTQVFELQATYQGVSSAPIIVYAEPQTGTYDTSQLSLNPAGTNLVGTLSFSDMKYLSWINISFPGTSLFQNWSCANDAMFCTTQNGFQFNESDLASGSIPVNISLVGTPAPPAPIVANISAGGNNSLSFIMGFGGGWSVGSDVQRLRWNYSVILQNPLPAAATTLSSNPVGPVVSGTVWTHYNATWKELSGNLRGAVGTISVSSMAGSTVLLSGTNLVNNGSLSYAWNTSLLPAGYNTLTLTVTTGTTTLGSTARTYYVAKPMIVASPSGGADVSQAVQFSTWGEGGAGTTYFWSFGDGASSLSATPTHTFATAGTYAVHVWVNDTQGLAVSASLNFKVSSALGVVAKATPSLLDFGSATTVTVSAAVSGGTSPFAYTWSGLPTGCSGATTASVTCNAPSVGNYSALVLVSDAVGNTQSSSVAIVVNSAFSATIVTVPTSPVSGSPFTIVVETSGGTPGYTYSYAALPAFLGCPSAPTTATVVCNPTSTGSFTVSVTVSDAASSTSSPSTSGTVVAPQDTSVLHFGSSNNWALWALLALAVVAALFAVLFVRERRKARGGAAVAGAAAAVQAAPAPAPGGAGGAEGMAPMPPTDASTEPPAMPSPPPMGAGPFPPPPPTGEPPSPPGPPAPY